MAFAIVNKFDDNGRIRVSKVYGPFRKREEAQVYNESSFPSPELNEIVPIYTPGRLTIQTVAAEQENRARTRAARLVQKATGVKYTEALRYVEKLHEDEPGEHYHFLARYGDPHHVEGETIYRLRCATCGGNTFAFATKASPVVED